MYYLALIHTNDAFCHLIVSQHPFYAVQCDNVGNVFDSLAGSDVIMWYMYSLSVITAVRRSGRTRGIAAAGSLPLPPPRPALHATAAMPAVLTPS